MSANEPAFPEVKSSGGEYSDSPVTSVWSDGGLTKREYFAAKAMQGILASDVVQTWLKENTEWDTKEGSLFVATSALNVADAILGLLAKEQTND